MSPLPSPRHLATETIEQEINTMSPQPSNAAQWTHAVGLARQSCARVFRDGGTPSDALATFGLKGRRSAQEDWSLAVEDIALELCRPGAV